jgi:hypothetical protein
MRSRLMHAGLATALLITVGAPGSVSANEGGCHSYAGKFTAEAVLCTTFCTHGTLTGDIEGTYDFVATDFTPTGLVGESTITLESGAVISGEDVSVLNPDGTFVTTVTIVGGTRQFEHATGTLVAEGVLTAAGTQGVYSAEICLGAGPE